MALVNMTELLKSARREGYAVGNFDALNVEMVKGIIAAGEELRSPVIIAYGEVFGSLIPVEDFAQVVVSAAQRASIPVVLHLDHANNFSIIYKALKHGFTSVMVDTSDKPIEENIAATQKLVEIAHAFGASTEAELGHVGGLEGQYESEDYGECAYTVVDEAKRFVAETGVDALAVAIGTVHGVYKSEPKLNLQRLAELKAAVDVPFVLHGGSGLSDDDLRACVKLGVSKLNIFTDLTLAAMEQNKADADAVLSYLDKCLRVSDAVKQVAMDRIRVFGSAGKA
jgi:fructose-bisphosphate aldolase class II